MINVRRLALSLLAAAVVAVASPSFAYAAIQNYHWMANIGAGLYDLGDQHNHYYNEMVVNNQGFLTNIHEETFCCGNKWAINGIGTIAYSHNTTYFTIPYCKNRGTFSYWVPWCDAEW